MTGPDRPPRGSTTVAGVVGDPVAHSLSPVLHNAAFAALDLDWVYVAFRVPPGAAPAAFAGARALSIAGLSVTMPHKVAAAAACDELTPVAVALGSVNTVTFGDDGRLVGDSTDGAGFLRSLRDAGHDPARRRVLVLGAGGSARAVVHALGTVGARVLVAARREPAAAEVAGLAPGAEPVAWAARHEHAGAVDLVVNATPVGMAGDPSRPLDPEAIGAGLVVVDLVYHPRRTPLLAAAAARGATAVGGLGMLVHQAALQFERWTGRPAPIAAMRDAASGAVGG